MKIGDEIYVHGFIDEIRGDTVIVRNEGGYFGTLSSEVKPFGKTVRWFDAYSTGVFPDEDGEYLVETTRGYEIAYYRKKEGQFGLMFYLNGDVSFKPIRVYAWTSIPEAE